MVSDKTTDAIYLSSFWKAPHCTNDAVIILVAFGTQVNVFGSCGSTGGEACLVWVFTGSPLPAMNKWAVMTLLKVKVSRSICLHVCHETC